ncbi:MAG: HTH domain-containing protein, partial [Clostridium sp.]|uniref:HTH domain-containing protein n=1 Tax=Clostridium sp. TaxID=1506 RepID=UPI00290AFF92
MLSTREIQLINLLRDQYPNYITSQEIADELGKGLRTIQQDIKKLKLILVENGAQIKFVNRKGYQIILTDKEKFQEFIERSVENSVKIIESQSDR